MSTRIKRICDTFATTNYIAQRQTAGLNTEDSLISPPFRGNTMNWILGHILVNRNSALEALGQAPYTSPEISAQYRSDSEPVTDVAKAAALDDLLAGLQESYARIETALKELSDAALEKIVAEADQTTLGDRLEGLAWHETYHIGQLELLRQLAGTNDKIF